VHLNRLWSRLVVSTLASLPLLCAQRPVARLTGLYPMSATAGGPEFTLYVQVPNFVDGMTVRWDGEDRPTTLTIFAGQQSVQATIFASDIAQPGLAEVSVYYPPSGVTIGTATFFTGTGIEATYLVADPKRNRIYAAMAGTFNKPGSEVAIIDPEATAVIGSIPVGQSPGVMAISDDARYLYIAIDGFGAIRRVDLDTGIPDLTIPLSPRGSQALDLAVMPGAPETLAVVLGSVAIYDRAVKRPNMSHVGTISLAFGSDGSTLYAGYGTVARLRIDQNGVAEETDLKLPGYYEDIRFARGLLYLQGGNVYDPASDAFTCDLGLAGDPVFDLKNNRALMIGAIGIFRDAGVLGAFDVNDCTPLGMLPVPALPAVSAFLKRGQLVLWGVDGVAFTSSTGGGMFILRTPLAAAPPTVTAIRGTVAPGQTLTVTGSGLGPTPARDALYTAPGEPSTELAGLKVLFDTTFAPILSASENELRVMVPADAGARGPAIAIQILNTGIPSQQIAVAAGATDPVAPQ
jgi:hypothetical protein